MTSTFTTRLWKYSRWFIAVFVVLFIFRLIYGYVVTPTNFNGYDSGNFFSNIDNLRKNYASEKSSMKNIAQQPAAMASNQKFEKTASIKVKSPAFEKDAQSIKLTAASFTAVIQYEQNLGQPGSRELHLLIGVNPERFDAFYAAVQKIGVIKATQITKVDKTNEYRQLNARKISIEKTLQSLNELKSKGGEIADFVSLNEKILEIEERLQELGVELGNFDTENEFCTVKLSMYEGATEKNIPIIRRVKVALEWSIKYFSILVLSSFLVALSALVLLLLADKLKIIRALNKTINEQKIPTTT